MTAAIIDTGNIGTDLLIKLQRSGVIAQEAGVRYIDGSLCALGAGAGNSPTEVLAAVFDRLGVDTGPDVAVLVDAEEVLAPYLLRWPKMDRNAIVQGWAGVYDSFLLPHRACRGAIRRPGRHPPPMRRARLRRRPGGHDHRRGSGPRSKARP